jgi:predicted MPP superfamily phosphohydrolase
MTRRHFLQAAGVATGAYLVGRGGWFLRGEKYDLHLTEWEVPVARLPRELDGLRILHFTDLHLTAAVSRRYLHEALAAMQRYPVDVICFTGDLLSTIPKFLRHFAPDLAALHAPRGKYAVLGNHDFFHGRRDAVVRTLQETGWEVLRNRSLLLPDSDGQVWVVGIDDPVTGREDVPQALEGVPSAVCRLGLGHTPDLVSRLSAGDMDLYLCGHTHGGQVVLPLVGPPVVNSQLGAHYAWGLFNYQGSMLQVSRGVGIVQPYYRLNCPPEIVISTLRAVDGALPTAGFRPRIQRLWPVWNSWRKN